MCQIGEVAQLCISGIHPTANGSKVTLHLQELTKVYSFDRLKKTELQKLTLRRLDECPQICPVTTLIDYLKCSQPLCHGEDKLFIIAGSYRGKSFGPAHKQTICRWIKEHFKAAGLGDFTTHSTWASSSTNALLMGMPMDEIIAKVGWLSSNTFVSRYMKPLAKFKHCMVPINQSDVGNSDRLIDKLVTTKDSNITDELKSKPKKPQKTRKTKKKVLENVNLATTGSTDQQAVTSENLTDSLTMNSTNVCSDNSCSDNRTATISPSMKKKSSKTVQLWKEKFMQLWGNDPRFKLPKNSKSNNRKDSFLSHNAEKSKRKPGKKKVQRKRKVSNVRLADKNKGSSDIRDNDNTDYNTSINDEMKTLDTIMTPEFMNTVLATDGPINTDNELMDFDVFDCMSESDLLDPQIADDKATDDIENNKSLTASCSSDTDLIDMNDIPITQVPMPELNKEYSTQTLKKQPNMSKSENSKLTKKKHTTTRKKRLQDESLKFVNYFT